MKEKMCSTDIWQMMPSFQLVNRHQFGGETVPVGDNEGKCLVLCLFHQPNNWDMTVTGIEKRNLHFYYPRSVWQVAIAKLFYVYK